MRLNKNFKFEFFRTVGKKNKISKLFQPKLSAGSIFETKRLVPKKYDSKTVFLINLECFQDFFMHRSATNHFALFWFAALKVVPTKNAAGAIFRKRIKKYMKFLGFFEVLDKKLLPRIFFAQWCVLQYEFYSQSWRQWFRRWRQTAQKNF